MSTNESSMLSSFPLWYNQTTVGNIGTFLGITGEILEYFTVDNIDYAPEIGNCSHEP